MVAYRRGKEVKKVKEVEPGGCDGLPHAGFPANAVRADFCAEAPPDLPLSVPAERRARCETRRLLCQREPRTQKAAPPEVIAARPAGHCITRSCVVIMFAWSPLYSY